MITIETKIKTTMIIIKILKKLKRFYKKQNENWYKKYIMKTK